MLFRTNAIDDRVRKTLVASLYTRPGALFTGAANGMIAALIAASYSTIPAIFHAAVLVSIIGFVRVVMAVGLPRLVKPDTSWLELIYEIGAFTYCLSVGVLGGMIIHYDLPTAAQLLFIAYVIGYASGMSARNAGRPVIAIGGLLFSLVPVCVALWNKPDLASRALIVAIFIAFIGMMSI
ncbi:MAG: hypothetical protein KGM49_02335, partial [Sphingomonadales bacterium]|nr:hypothetical protein [Sphingomonadales bacterium]